MKCFYHSADLDGHCSGALIKMAYPDCDLIGINYGDEFPWLAVNSQDQVFMVDFALQPFELMQVLAQRCDLTWIDHHKSAIEEARDLPFFKFERHRLEIGKGACQLVWEYLDKTNCFPVEDHQMLKNNYMNISAGEKIKISVLRNNQRFDYEITTMSND